MIYHPIRLIDRGLDRLVGIALNRESQPIGRSNIIAAAIWIVLLIGANTARSYVSKSIADALLIIPTVMAGLAIPWISGIGRKLTWQRGYRHGRNSWYASMVEARNRGISVEDWINAELERDSRSVRVRLYEEE